MLSLCFVCTGGIQTLSKHTGGVQTYGASKCMGAYGHPLSLTKHELFVLYMYSRHPNIFQTYGGIQTYGVHPNIWECPHIQGASKHRSNQTYRGVSKHMGIQTYRRVSKHGGHPNIQGVHQNKWEASKHIGVSK